MTLDKRKFTGVCMNIQLRNIPNSIVFGLLTGIDGIAFSLALAQILFNGPLRSGLALGFGAIMIGMIIFALIIGQFSAQKNAVGEIQEVGVGILVVALATMTLRLDEFPTEEKISTAFVIIGLSTILSGAVLIIIGMLRIGNVVRFLPQPVVAGFLAGSGWTLFLASVEFMTRLHINEHIFSNLSREELIGIILPAISLAFFTYGMQVVLKNSYSVPAILILSLVTFFAIYFSFNTNLDYAREVGWIPESTNSVNIEIPDFSLIEHVHWNEVINALPLMASIILLTVISVMLKWTSLELALSADLNINSELIITGIGNLIAGCFGSPTGFVGFRTTLMAEQLGARDRLASVSVAIVLILGLFNSRYLIGLTPTFFTAGLMLYGSMLLLYQWVVKSRSQMEIFEWAITLAILVSIILFGMLYGIVIGFSISCLNFVYNYAKLPAIRNIIGGHELRSLVDRSQIETRYLVQHGHSIAILRLQGYLFFGTAESIVRTVRDIVAVRTRTPVRAVILDFSHVSGIDSAAASGFLKISYLTSKQNAKLYFCKMSSSIDLVLQRSGQVFDQKITFCLPDLDHALEVCEDNLLSENRLNFENVPFENHIASILGYDRQILNLIREMERFDLDIGEALIRAGDQSDDIFIVADGRIKVEIKLQDGTRLRLRSMTKGAIVGEVGYYLNQKRSADIVVEEQATLYRMSTEKLKNLESKNPNLAVLFHRLIAISLSEKMLSANQLISLSKQ